MNNHQSIGSFSKVRRGASPRPIGDPNYFGGDVGWVRISDVTQRNKKYLKQTEQYLSELGESKSLRVDKGDLIMSICATVGKPMIVDMPACIHDGFVQIYDIKDADTEYLYYLLQFHEKDFEKRGQPGTQVNLNTTIVEREVVFFPKYQQQKKIAEIISTVDNLIDQTQNLIDKYTAIKQGMMADLFSRGIDLSGTPETNKNYGQLRPSSEEAPELYQETELGWVPDGWEIVTLESIATVERGKFTHRPRDDAKCYGGIHPFIQTGSVTKSQGGFIMEYKQTLSDFGRNVSREFPKGTIAVTIAANIADTGILNIPMCFPDSVVGVVVNNELSTTRFVEISIRRNKRRLDALAPLSAQKNINLEDLRPLKIALPNIEEQKELCLRYETQESLIHKEKEYLEKLKLKKKGLMQDLLTGKVSVI